MEVDWLWLEDYEWTITPRAGDSSGAFYVYDNGYVHIRGVNVSRAPSLAFTGSPSALAAS